MSAILNYFNQAGIAFSMLLNALSGGQAGQTLSYRAALGEEARKPFWCALCRVAAWLRGPNYCAEYLAGIEGAEWLYVSAFLGLCVVAVILTIMLCAIMETSRHILHPLEILAMKSALEVGMFVDG